MKKNIIILIIIVLGSIGCTKTFLDKKPDQSLIVPTTTADLQAILDNLDVNNVAPSISQMASDEFYMDASDLQFYTKTERGAYTWQKDLYDAGFSGEWSAMYRQIFYANLVLKQSELSISGLELNQIKGSAYYYRAWGYYHLGQLFAPPYVHSDADMETQLPLRTKPDIDQRPPFATLSTLYERINSDLDQAEALLGINNSYKSRPSKQAVYALRARTRLLMADYIGAEASCDAYLALSNELIDFNTLIPSAARPLPPVLDNKNNEGVFYSQMISYAFLTSALLKVDPELYQLYSNDDLRKTCFFRDRGNGVITYKGSYTGTPSYFAGIATDEIVLTRAECRIRNNKILEGMADLNRLRQLRWKKNSYVPLNPPTANEALILVLQERRRELIARGTRWVDLRRLNQEPAFAKTITRNLGQVVYQLKPNEDRYVFPIPESELQLNN